MSFAEYNAIQWFWHGARTGFRLPHSDLPLDRYVERPMPRQLRPANWGDHPAANDIVRLPQPFRNANSADGRPAQLGHAHKRTLWQVNDSYGPAFQASVPVPMAGDYWTEGAPRPLWSMAFSDHYDKHVIVTDPTRGGWFEMIGATNWGQWRCSGLAQYDRHGELVRGRPVIASKRALLPLLWNRFDMPHLCTITVGVTNGDRDPRYAQHLGKWLVLDAGKVPMPKTEEGRRLYESLTTFGAIYGDHGGVTNLSGVSGGQWSGIDWGGLEFRLSDFLLAS